MHVRRLRLHAFLMRNELSAMMLMHPAGGFEQSRRVAGHVSATSRRQTPSIQRQGTLETELALLR